MLLPEETLINLILVYENNLLLRLRSSMGSLTAAEVEMSGAVPTAGTVPNGDAARLISRDDDPNHLPDLPGLIKYSINNNKDGGRKQTRNDKRLVLPKIPNSFVTTAKIESKAPEVGINVASLQGHKATVTQCHVLPVIVITSSLDSSLRLWDRETFQFIVELKCLNPVHRFLCLDRESTTGSCSSSPRPTTVGW